MLTTMLILFLIKCDSVFTKGTEIVSTLSQIPFATSMYSFFILLQKFSLLRDMPSGLCAFQLSPWLACTNLTLFIHGEITTILWTPTLVILDATESQHGLRLSWDEDSDPSDLWRQYPRENQVKEWGRQSKKEMSDEVLWKGASSSSWRGPLEHRFYLSPESSLFPHPSGIGQGPLGIGREAINSQRLSACVG